MKRYIVTGAPGTGKTSLVQLLAHLGEVVGEPARELIAEHRAATGEQSLDGSPELFVQRLIARSIEKFDGARADGVTIYDRGLPDCVAYANVFGVDPSAALAAAEQRRYSVPVLVAAPWEEIYTMDELRQATFAQVTAFHDELIAVYRQLGYQLVELPKTSVAERVRVVTKTLQSDNP